VLSSEGGDLRTQGAGTLSFTVGALAPVLSTSDLSAGSSILVVDNTLNGTSRLNPLI
jgi:hypothetical protein